MSDSIVIVGAGHAGCAAAETLRREGYHGRLVLVGGERHLPYQRPPLSKKLLAGEQTLERTLLKAQTFYEQAGIELRLGTLVTAIDCAQHRVTLAGGEHLEYSRLLLCLGGEA